MATQRPLVKEARMGIGAPQVRAKKPGYSPQSKDKTLKYTPQPEEEEPHCNPQSDNEEPKYTPRLDGEMVKDNFDEESEDDLQINYGIVSVLPAEYGRVSEVSEVEENFVQDQDDNRKPLG